MENKRRYKPKIDSSNKPEPKNRYWLLKHKYLILILTAVITGIFGLLNNWFSKSKSIGTQLNIKTNNGKVVNQNNPSKSTVVMGDQNTFNNKTIIAHNVKNSDPDISIQAVSPFKFPAYVGKNEYMHNDSLYFLVSLKNIGTGSACNIIDETDCFKLNRNPKINDKYFWVAQNPIKTLGKSHTIKAGESRMIDYPFPTTFINDTLYFYFKMSYTTENGKKEKPIEFVLEFHKDLIESNLPYARSNVYDEILEWVKIFNTRHSSFLKERNKLLK